MRLDIPPGDRDVLRWWFSASEGDAEKVLGALERAEPALTPHALARRVAANLGLEGDATVHRLVVLVALTRTIEGFEEEERSNAGDILFQSIFPEEEGAPERSLFDQRLERIVRCKPIQITSKAAGVLATNAHNFCGARTLSEIRPIFGEVNLEPEAAVIAHQLQLEYYAGADMNERRSMLVAMDRRDVEKLIAVLKRTLDKDDKLRSMAQRIALPLLAEEEGHAGMR